MSLGRFTRRFLLASLVTVVALTAVPNGASAATTIGQTFAPANPCTPDVTRLQTISPGGQYAAPSDGVITQWNFQAPAAPGDVPQLKFKVARPAGGNDYTLIGESRLEAPVISTLNSYFVQIPVHAGDLIGTYVNTAATNKLCATVGSTGYTESAHLGDVVPPTMTTFTPNPLQIQLDVSAKLESDCDKDGLGDETQDSDTAFCKTPAGVAALTCKGQQATIVGTNGNDVRGGTPGSDVMVGQGGNDSLSGLAGNDVVCGGPGKDTLKGGKGADSLLGQKGKDTLKGGGGRDFCKGGKGKDTASKCEVEKSI